MVMTAFKRLLLVSIALATLAFIMPWAAGPATRDLAIRVSMVLVVGWLAIVVYALIRFGRLGLWFLLGTPLVVFWLFVLFMIAWGCALSRHAREVNERYGDISTVDQLIERVHRFADHFAIDSTVSNLHLLGPWFGSSARKCPTFQFASCTEEFQLGPLKLKVCVD